MSFVAFVLLFAGLIISGNNARKKDLLSDIEHVSKDNVIVYQLDNGEETSMYVTGVQGDTLFVRQNRMSVEKGNTGLIDKPENYSEKTTIFTKTQLYQLAEEIKIKGIYMTSTSARFNSEIFE